ncbi:hypothetical protein GCM10009868_39300 [Terrabacter aerolatus]|uniref:WxL domain-containing protein n=1 Tax=Terrabacter aerolatus TaxID=422442 RepID=A0A512D0E5_9MICO|nr:hypothetical protein [Terrabacter aerolatus]GEO29937.1 hypothetical protein TAE01_17470 [Terrabacter aerolatus]
MTIGSRVLLALGVVGALSTTLAAAGPAKAAERPLPSAAMSYAQDANGQGDDEGANGLQLLTSSLPSLVPGQNAWGSLLWTTGTKVCNVAVTATSTGATIDYPTNTKSSSSFYKGTGLEPSAIDFTALSLSVPTTTTKAVTVTVTARYTMAATSGDDHGENGKANIATPPTCTSTVRTSTYKVTLPVSTPSGPAVTARTTSAVIAAGSVAWVPLSFTANRAGVDNFRLQAKTLPVGLSVVYPSDGVTSGLSNDTSLPAGGTDFAAIRFDATKLARGTYSIPTIASWAGGSLDSTLTLSVN